MTELTQIIGFIAGAGTTFAAQPDLIAILKRLSSDGMNPRMAAISGTFQILWVIYGVLNRFEKHRYVKCDRSRYELSHRWGVHVLSSPRRAIVTMRNGGCRASITFWRECSGATLVALRSSNDRNPP